MASSSSKLIRRSSSFSFPYLLLSFLNAILFILSSASLTPIILLKTPPTSLGIAFVLVSSISLISSFIGFYSKLTRQCFTTHLSLLLASLIAHLLTILALFTRENSTLSLLKSARDSEEAKFLVRLEYGVFMGMFILEVIVMMLTCAVQSCWVREYQGLTEADPESSAKERSKRRSMDKVDVEVDNKVKEVDDVDTKMDSSMLPAGQWVKTEFEARSSDDQLHIQSLCLLV